MRRLSAITGNSQKLDGGAMFGNVPKTMWSRWVEADAENRINLACRALLIEEANRFILLETGIGAFFEPKLKERFGVVEAEHVLLQSLAGLGVSHEQIDIVVLSHLHFDHAGGLLSCWQQNSAMELLFPKAQFLVSEVAFARAEKPHFRDRASFIPALPELLKKSGRLQLINTAESALLGPDYRFHFSDGHTPGLMLTEIKTATGPVVFASDLIPATPWVHLPVTMGYDRAAELLIDEKRQLLNYLLPQQGRLFYTHDPAIVLSNIACDEQGRFSAVQAVGEAELVRA